MRSWSVLILLLALLPVSALAQTPPPTNLSAVHDGDGGVTLTWNAPNALGLSGPLDMIEWPETDAERLAWPSPDFAALRAEFDQLPTSELDEFLHYRIYRDGGMIGLTQSTSYTTQLGDYGSFEFTVTAFYDEGESAEAGPVTVVWYDPENYLVLEDFNDLTDLPDGWWVEATIPQYTWSVVQDDGLIDSPHVMVDSDAAGSGGVHMMERLILPMLDFDHATYAEIQFDHAWNEYIEEDCYLEVRISGGDWITVAHWTDDFITTQHETIDLSDWVLDEEEVELSFYYDDNSNWGFYWSVDNITVYKQGPLTPVTLDMNPTQTTIPQTGGQLVYDIVIESTLPNTIPGVRFWTMAELPNGNMYGPILNVPLTITPFMYEYFVGMTQQVPGWAPPGSYEYIGHIGFYPNPYVSDSFSFTKLGGEQE